MKLSNQSQLVYNLANCARGILNYYIKNYLLYGLTRAVKTLKGSNTHSQNPGGGLGISTNRDQRSIFLGFESRMSVFFWVLVTDAVFFFGLLNNCCISEYFIF